MAGIRVKANYPAAQYRRLKPRRGHKRALGAVKHTLICAIWHRLSTGGTYRDLGPDYFANRDPERQTKRLVKQLERLGHHVTLQEGPRQPERTFPVRQGSNHVSRGKVSFVDELATLRTDRRAAPFTRNEQPPLAPQKLASRKSSGAGPPSVRSIP